MIRWRRYVGHPLSMSIDPTLPDRLAAKAQATGGLLEPLQGNDVLKEQLDLEPSDRPEANPEEGIEVASAGNLLRKGARNLLGVTGPNADVFNQALKKVEQMEADAALEDAARKAEEAADPEAFQRKSLLETINAADAAQGKLPDNLRTAIDEARARLDAQEADGPQPLLLTDPNDDPTERAAFGLGEELEKSNEAGYKASAVGNTFNVDDKDAADVLSDIKKPTVVSEDGMLTDFRARGAAGDEKIPDEGQVYSTIEAISQQYSSQITTAKRDVITQEATRELADLVGLTPNRLLNAITNRKTGGVINVEGMGLAESMLAARDLFVVELKKLDKLADVAETGGDAEAAAFREQLEFVAQIQANIKGSQTEIARALGAFRIPARGEAADTSRMRTQDLASIVESFGGTGDIRDLAKAYNQQATLPHQKMAFARQASKFGRFSDAMYEAWINILLSNPVTHFKNFVGAGITTFANVPETYGAASVGALRRALGREGGTEFSQANAQMFGVVMGLIDAFSGAARAFRTGEKPIPGSKLETLQGQRPVNAFSSAGMTRDTKTMSALATGVDVLGHVMTLGRIPTRLLDAEDTFFKVIAHRMSLYEGALSSGRGLGLEGEALVDHVADFLFNPPDTAVAQSEAFAKYVTLQSDLDPIGKAFSDARKVPVLRYFVPFLKTPYNSFKYVFRDRTPLGLMSPEIRSQIMRGSKPGATDIDKKVSDMAVARMSMGSIASVAFAYLTMQGHMTGAGPSDRGLQTALRAQGWRPYSIRIPGTKSKELPMGQHVSYTAFEPFTTVFMLGADASELMMDGSLKEQDGEKIAGHVAAMFANQLTDKTFMSGFADLVSTFQDPQRYAGSTLQNFVSSVNPRVVAQLKKTGVPGLVEADPFVRQTKTFLDQIKKNVPGWSETLPPRRNYFGQAVMLDGAVGPDIVSPLYSSAAAPPDDRLIERGASGPKYNQRALAAMQFLSAVEFAPFLPNDMLENDRFEGTHEGIEMSLEQYDYFMQEHGVEALKQVEAIQKKLKGSNLTALAQAGDPGALDIIHRSLNGAFRNARAVAKAKLYAHPEFGPELMLEREDYYNRIQERYKGISQ